MAARPRLESCFARILAWRIAIVVLFGALVPVFGFYAAQLRADSAVDSLMVESDPDYLATQAFQKVFPESQVVLLLLEFDDPFQPAAILAVDTLAKAVHAIPDVSVFSPLEIYRRAHPGYEPKPDNVDTFKRFLTGADALRRQGLWGEHFLAVGVALPSRGPEARDRTLAALDSKLAAFEASLKASRSPVRLLRKVGAPYLHAWIERESNEALLRGFPLYALMVLGFAWLLYRSARALCAIFLSLVAAVALALGAGELLGFGISIVSALVPLTVLVTTLASLVYLHSRFVHQPPELPLPAHHVQALADKFLPVTASSLAAALGFLALAVSPVRPVREMGLWTAAGLTLSWLVTFTLFPALQRLLHTPTGRVVAVRTRFYDSVADRVPAFSYRYRWALLLGSLTLSAAGLAALFGVPGYLAPARVSVEGLDYVDPKLPIHRDLAYFQEHVAGLNVARIWLRVPEGTATTPEVLSGLDRFATGIEGLPMVSSVVGPTTFLRMRQYLAGQGAQLPDDPAAMARLAADTESLLLSERDLRGFIDVGSLSDLQLTVTFRRGEHADYADLKAGLLRAFEQARAASPGLKGAEFQVVGESMLQAKVGASLIPTLTHSFLITAALIFVAFLAVFRSPSARLMAMIPSLFAILVTFLGLRLFGGSLNVATILIATTVLGTTENDQIHFFYHLQEATGQPLDAALRHALRVSGQAIFFATVINATGFLGLAFSNFPPLRQLGIETSVAFTLAMLADFTALPGALWIVHRARPSSASHG